ncbi:MAG: helix-turn-helix domain-containing protein [Acidobacteriota bacterium]
MIVSTTYKGIHEYGKRSRKKEPRIILRPVPVLVSEQIWARAQKTLRSNFIFAKRNVRHKYLLRGLMKCQLCGLTFSGSMGIKSGDKVEFYYRCNGYQQGRGTLGRSGERCTSKALRGNHLETQIWADVERFLRDPGPVLQQLHAKLGANVSGADKIPQRMKRLEALLAQKADEQKRVVGLFRRGRITAKVLDEQMEEIASEELTLKAEIDALRGSVTSAASVRKTLDSAEGLLAKLRERLDGPVSWELKRELIEILVAGIQVDTIEVDGVRQNQIAVNYRFSEPGDSRELLLSHAYSANPLPPPETVGDHIRTTRLKRKLVRREVAEQLGVDECSIYNWESNRIKPELRYLRSIIDFLGYNPLPVGTNWPTRLVNARLARGLNQKQSAELLGVDPSTLARWERGEREPTGTHGVRAHQFLKDLPR